MKVKISDTIYDANEKPIMVILDENDKNIIKNMIPEATKYCEYPKGMTEEEALKWMSI